MNAKMVADKVVEMEEIKINGQVSQKPKGKF